MKEDFDRRLDQALAMHGLDNAAFASALGPDGQQKVHNWRKRGRIGRPSVAEIRPILPMVSFDWLNDGVGSPVKPADDEKDWDNVRGYAQAVGLGTGVEAQEYAETHKLKFRSESLAKKRLHAENLAVMYGSGDSMLPRIRQGDAILFDTHDKAPRDGALYVILVDGVAHGEYQVKRALALDDAIYFAADNPAGDHQWSKPRRMDAKRHGIQVIGRVRWIGSWED